MSKTLEIICWDFFLILNVFYIIMVIKYPASNAELYGDQ